MPDPSPGDAAAPPHDPMIIREGVIFEAGVYPDKGFSLTPEELRSAVEQFSAPVPVNLAHLPTVLDGKLGEVRSVRLSDDGRKLIGTAALPKWLDDLLGANERKVSCEWDRAKKTLHRLSLVRSPRIADAALFAAFGAAHPEDVPAVSAYFAAAHKTPQGLSVMQSVHDMTAGAGAVCDPGNSRRSLFHSARERSGVQKLHDTACDHGATCSVMDPDDSAPAKGSKMSLFGNFMKLFESGETPPPAEIATFAADLVRHDAQVAGKAGETHATTTATVASFADSPEAKAMADKIKALEASNRLKDIAAAAATFAASEIGARRALPRDHADLVADFTEAALDDDAAPKTVTFSDGNVQKTGSRVDRLRAKHARRPSLAALYAESLTDTPLPAGASVLFADRGEKSDPAAHKAEKDRLLAMTDNGQHVIAMRNGNGKH